MIVLGIVATIVVPNVRQKVARAELLKIRVDLTILADAVEMHHTAHGAYPSTMKELVLREHMPVDPWNRPYVLQSASDPTARPNILTLGRDGVPGGDGPDTDIDLVWFARSDSK